MRKKQTPQQPQFRRASFFSLNEASQSRRSSSIAYAKQDARPVNTAAGIRTINAYLQSHNFNILLPPKSIPAGPYVRELILFLVRQLDPNWEINKLEEEVPFLLKAYGYSGQLTKSTFVFTHHTWPVLISALSWLVQILIYRESVSGRVITDSFFDFVESSYPNYMLVDDEADEAATLEFLAALEEEKSMAAQSCMEKEACVQELKARLESLQTGTSLVEGLARDKADLANDVKKFEVLVANLMEKKEKSDKVLHDKERELQAKIEEIERAKQEVEGLRLQVECQQVNVRDFEKMNREAQSLDLQIQSAEALRKQREDNAWKLEVATNNKLKELEATMNEYNQEIARTKLGGSFEYKLNPNGGVPSEILGLDPKSVKSRILSSIDENDGNQKNYWEEHTKLQQQLHDKISKQEMKRKSNKQLLVKIEKLEHMSNLIKKETEEYASWKASECQILLSEREKAEEEMKKEEAEEDSSLQKATMELEKITKGYDEEIKACSYQLLQLIDAFSKEKELVERTLASGKAMLNQTAEAMKSVGVSTPRTSHDDTANENLATMPRPDFLVES